MTSLSLTAGLIVETEVNGAATNNSTATAQVIAGSAFTVPPPAGVFAATGTATVQGLGGFDDVDFYSFQNTFAGSWLHLDIDNSPATFDTIIALFNSSGTLIGYGEDTNPLDAGSASTIDSLLAPFQLAALGTYYIAVAEFPNYPSAALLFTEAALSLGGRSVAGATPGLASFDFSDAQPAGSLPYRLQVSVATPEPGTFGLLGAALILVGAGLRRRRR